MLSSIGRAAIRRVVAAPSRASTNKIPQSNRALQRLDGHKTIGNTSLRPAGALQRCYATAGRSKGATTKSKAPTKKAAAKPKSKPKLKKAVKAPKKNVKKVVKKKPAVKKKKILTPAQKENALIKELKAIALSPPKKKPYSAWTVYVTEANATKATGETVATVAKAAAPKFRALGAAELEQLNHKANQNKLANNIAYKDFIQSYTPDQIRLANNARKQLKKKTKGASWTTLVDERIPSRGQRPLSIFIKERFNSGDFRGVKTTEALSLIVKEYKELSPSHKQKYEDLSAADQLRYEQEYKTVFHRDTPTVEKKAAAAAAA